ncbi:MAG: type II toxin-antitoxin system Phd/YefM family antitoxin [Lautropia sp.]|nr:MAG: type II toxin-antitoxin system Phd/YefM family antitoxin [Pseudomonadota bacterium]MBC6960359.1 type II toxin-antitoxin system Phd/YefM family antitoxin [Lautropia sp.]MCL4702167.1 type II toxin-antitoxin system prevent-host-death family antitoxin [Burkholderiaceae bacterium]MCZ2415310.1 type II toxin-antitoxin system Phd/YefM family antitoxin [Burkholderiales bacterium]MDL1908105.1 type II toxin-antitoxin system Phd/YefM family antitoxin [Betaproteobacteria bacterium PRO1]NUN94454.1 t
MRTVSAADASRHFSAILKEVSRGARIAILSRGKPVAALVPVAEAQRERREARGDLLKRLRFQAASGKRTWTREELYASAASCSARTCSTVSSGAA